MSLATLKPPGMLIMEGDMNLNWERWYTAYDIYSVTSGVRGKPERVQCCVFLHIAGPETQTIYRQFKFEQEERDKITPLVEAFKRYCEGKKSVTVSRFRFGRHNQTTETIDIYIAQLRNKIKDCEFGELEESLLRDRIIGGVACDSLREKLLQTEDIDLNKCIKLCQLSEIKATDLSVTTQNTEQQAVDAVTRSNAYAHGRNDTPRQAQKSRDRYTRRQEKTDCDNCGYYHYAGQCPAKGKACNYCSKVGHFAKVCRTRMVQSKPVHAVHMRQEEAEDPNNIIEMLQDEDLYIGEIKEDGPNSQDPWYEKLTIHGQTINFKLDTGSQTNIIDRATFNRMSNTTRRPTGCTLTTYAGNRIIPDGETTLKVRQTSLIFHIVASGGPILGKQACEHLQLITRVNTINKQASEMTEAQATGTSEIDTAHEMVKKYNDVFNGLGLIKTDAKLYIDKNVQPSIDPPRRIPHAISHKVKNELDRMIEIGVIAEQVEPTEWVNSITIVKKTNKVRICLDPTKLNKAILRGAVQTRTVEEVAAKTHGSKYFTVLDANSGYWQVELDRKSSELTTFNTPWGRYRYLRLPFGIKTAGDIFIAEMDRIMNGLEGVSIITDDILVYGATEKEHNERLEKVLMRAREANLKLNPDKSKICEAKVQYVGHILSGQGIQPDPDRIQAINDMPVPTDKPAVQRFLGMINYVHKFIQNLSDIAKPLRILLGKEIEWHWQAEQQKSFDELKRLLATAPVLRYYDVSKPITIQVDACKSGLGATLLQDGHPIAMASKALTDTQCAYAVIEKELLAICFGTNKFHEYIFGKEVLIQTDHKPLVAILDKPMHKLTARIQRMRMRLLNYDIKIMHVKGTEMYFADTISRAHTQNTKPDNIFDTDITIAEIGTENISLTKIRDATAKDPTLQTLNQTIRRGWPTKKEEIPPCIKPYATFKNELTIHDHITLKGEQIIIPQTLQKDVLKTLHETHAGIVKTKQAARDTVYWPNIAQQIEDQISRCHTCQQTRNRPHTEPLISHQITDIPFNKVGVDLFEINNTNFIIIVDYYSKYPEIAELSTTTTQAVIKRLTETFCRFGIPAEVVSDNGPQFSSAEYKQFAKTFGFKITHSSPQHPQSNGQAERYVQTIKNIIKKNANNRIDVQLALLNYRNTALDGIGASPAQLLMCRRLKTRIPIFKQRLKAQQQKSVIERIKARQNNQKYQYDRHAGKIHKEIFVGQQIRYITHKNTWAKGTIISKDPNQHRSYNIANEHGNIITRNRKQIIQNKKEHTPTTTNATRLSESENNPIAAQAHRVSSYGRVIKHRNILDL